MPHAATPAQFRLRFLQALAEPGASVTSVCREFAISRPTFYLWKKRFQAEGSQGLVNRSCAPRRCPQSRAAAWREELLSLRRQRPHWGAKKLRVLLAQHHPRTPQLPSLRTLERWLGQARLTRFRSSHDAPVDTRLRRQVLAPAHAPNEVWTIDFKGRFRLGNGRWCDVLTVRDLASRFILAISPVPAISDQKARAVLRPLFKRWGLPQRIRCDNGTPFGNVESPRNFTTLSVWWWRLGIVPEFSRPAKPQDNGSHEQMHRVLKAETLSPPCRSLPAQRLRFAAWQKDYNEVRPHEALSGQRQVYHPSAQPWRQPPLLAYHPAWLVRRVRSQGTIRLLGRTRNIGRAFAGQSIGLEPFAAYCFRVHLGALLLGSLHGHDHGGLRPIIYHPRPSRHRRSPSTVKDVVAGFCKGCRGGKV